PCAVSLIWPCFICIFLHGIVFPRSLGEIFEDDTKNKGTKTISSFYDDDTISSFTRFEDDNLIDPFPNETLFDYLERTLCGNQSYPFDTSPAFVLFPSKEDWRTFFATYFENVTSLGRGAFGQVSHVTVKARTPYLPNFPDVGKP